MDTELAERAARVKRLEPAWNELREQRVLGRIAEGRRQRVVGRRRNATLGAAAAAVVLLAAGAWLAWGGASAPVAGRDEPARIDLRDGSAAILSGDARVRIDEQRPDGIFLSQQTGVVTYDVAHDPSRAFVVRAAHVTVRVRGTHFIVTMESDWVEVRVDEGRVEVEAHGQQTVLGAGDQLRVSKTPPQDTSVDHAVGAPEPPEEEAASTGTAPADPVQPRAARSDPAPVRRPDTADGRRRRAAEPPRPDPDPAPDPATPTLEQRMSEADSARRAGRVEDAVRIVRAAVEENPTAGPRLQELLFTLGRLERRRGMHADAASAFARARRIAVDGPLAEDALAEEAVSAMEAGMTERARLLARQYLEAHPDGLHASRVRPLLE